MQNSYTVIHASAGSGKTYSLVQRILRICLRYPNQHTAIQHILALTFTNKAANEMKERILNWLAAFTSDNFAENKDLINLQKALQEEENIHVNLEDLHNRAQNLLDYVLHNYSILQIGTIDKFNSRLVRSFSNELGLAKNFNLEINAKPLLIEAVDKMLDQVGNENRPLTDALLDYINYQLDQNERTNLNKTFYESAQTFLSDIHHEHLKLNDKFNTEEYEKTTKKLRQDLRNTIPECVKIAKKAQELIANSGLEAKDFAGGNTNGIAVFFTKFLKNISDGKEEVPLPKDEYAAAEKFDAGASKSAQKKEHLVLAILDELKEHRLAIIRKYVTAIKKRKILNAILPLKVHQDIKRELEIIEEENDVVLLSKVNVLIQENLSTEPSEFIYEKVGTQFHHYFFDEFQDTSVLQWQNFLPLRDHTISMDHTSFTLVGDPKQSIYRFRGGESKILLNIINNKDAAQKQADIILLKENWRSAENIVAFNNELYHFISKKLRAEHQNIFGESAMQLIKSSRKGRIRINFIENLVVAEYFKAVAAQMQADIQELLNSGYQFSDITILCRNGSEIFNFSQQLGNLEVEYCGKSQYIRTISESGLTLELSDVLKSVIQFLSWENNPQNHQYLVMMMYYLKETGKIQMQDFTADMLEILALQGRMEMVHHIEQKYGIKLLQNGFPQFNLYNFIEFYVHEFSVINKETDFILNFLEMVYAFTQNSGATLKDFLKFWEEEGRKKTIQASENLDAVQLMTIHKAKGLEFPIVFLPMLHQHKDKEFNEWFPTEENPALKSVNLKYFKKDLAVYDAEVEKFNTEHTYENLLDRMCLQYVATTRAVEQMFLYIERPTEKDSAEKESKLEIYDFLQLKNTENSASFDFFELPPLEDLKKTAKEVEKEYVTKKIEHFNTSHEKTASIKIATPSKNYQNRNEKVRTGIFTHEILAKINTLQNLETVLETYLLAGTIDLAQKAEIEENIQMIIKKYPQYFNEDLEIINEKDIMISENGISQIYRPDRLIKTEEGYFIIDFKTGAEHTKHLRQIETYERVLQSLGKKVAGKEIVYI